MPQKKYKVLNPLEMPKGVRLIEFHGKEWFEGDEFTRPPGMSDYGMDRLIREGKIEEAGRG